jgi:YegS/Rv2252/BmrU family lipid kinase
MRVTAILNPRAGTAAKRARAALGSPPTGWLVDLQETRGPGHARELATEAARKGADLVLAAGGDGTANETAAGLLGSEVPLGVLPMGSGNGLARTLRLPMQPTAALAALAAGRAASMDVGTANGELFLNIAGAGFDAVVGHAFHQRGRHGGRRGIAPYVLLAATRLHRYKPPTFRMEIDGAGVERSALLVAALNGRQFGAGAALAPGARLNDGLLDLVVIGRASLGALLLGAARMFLGGLERCHFYEHRQLQEITLHEAGVSHRDGEPEPARERLVWRVRPGALRIQAPTALLDDPEGPFGHSR